MAKRRASSKYLTMLQDPRWQKVRLETMQKANFACEKCGDKTSTLNVHHKNYKYGRNPWEYESNNFVCLCSFCHDEIHEQREMINNLLPYSFVNISELISGVIAAQSNNYCVAKIHPREFASKTELYLGGIVTFLHENLDEETIGNFVEIFNDRHLIDEFIDFVNDRSGLPL